MSDDVFRPTGPRQYWIELRFPICGMIEDPDNAPHVRDALSTTYGVNGLSVMNRVANFDVCQCFPEDIMHILFDGVVPCETKRFLKVLIDEK